MEYDPAPSPLTNVDLAVLLAARAWGGELPAEFWNVFAPGRRSTLRWGWREEVRSGAASARGRLLREHTAQARPDLGRVHSSWWVRALQGEPPSIRRTVVASLPLGVSEALRQELDLEPEDLSPDRLPHPEALQAAVALWCVRLAGDLDERPDDPPVIVALTRFDARTVARFLQTTGLAKWSLTAHPTPDLDGQDRERFEHFRRTLVESDPRYLQVALREVGAISTEEANPLKHAGMTCFSRLLTACDPYRVRWALQHIPYSSARTLRILMGPGGRKAPMLVRWESDILRAVWDRLHDEGRISTAWESRS